MILGLCGYSGTGKTTFANLIKEMANGECVQITSTGNAIRKMMEAKGIEATQANLQSFNADIKNQYREKYILIALEAIDPRADIVVVDALRTMMINASWRASMARNFACLVLLAQARHAL